MIESFEAASALNDAPSLVVNRIDGGWIVVVPGPMSVPIQFACKRPLDVLNVVVRFFDDRSVQIRWSPRVVERMQESSFSMLRIEGGYLLSHMDVGSDRLIRLVRFDAKAVLETLGVWMGMAPLRLQEETSFG